MTDLKRLLRYLGPYRRDMVIGALLVVIETAFELFIPLLMADLIDVGVKNHDVPYILQQGVYMGICALRPMAGAPGSGRSSIRRYRASHFPIWIISSPHPW